jgi:uncharacterized protein (TIGR00645 family)
LAMRVGFALADPDADDARCAGRVGVPVLKSPFESLLFASRWLLTPFYVALVIALLALLGKVGIRAYGMVTQFPTFSEEDVILGALGIVDLTLTASLIILVIFSGYANFISRVDVATHPSWPRWMADIDFSELKLKLMASIVAISAIKLLEAYMNIDHETDRQLAWQAGVLGVFVASALLLGIAEWLGQRGNGSHE